MNSNPGGRFRPVLLALSLALASCAGLSYTHTGLNWDIPATATLTSASISPRRDVTLAVAGTLDSGSVTVTVYADAVSQGTLEVPASGAVDAQKRFDYVPGLWRFEAVAADGSSGSLYVEIEDR